MEVQICSFSIRTCVCLCSVNVVGEREQQVVSGCPVKETVEKGPQFCERQTVSAAVSWQLSFSLSHFIDMSNTEMSLSLTRWLCSHPSPAPHLLHRLLPGLYTLYLSFVTCHWHPIQNEARKRKKMTFYKTIRLLIWTFSRKSSWTGETFVSTATLWLVLR